MHRTRTLLTGLAGTVALATVLAGCGASPSNPPSGVRSSQAPAAAGQDVEQEASATPSPTTPPVELEANVDDGASKVEVSTLVRVKASAGTLSKVS